MTDPAVATLLRIGVKLAVAVALVEGVLAFRPVLYDAIGDITRKAGQARRAALRANPQSSGSSGSVQESYMRRDADDFLAREGLVKRRSTPPPAPPPKARKRPAVETVTVCEAESLLKARTTGPRLREAVVFYEYRMEEVNEAIQHFNKRGNKYEQEWPGIKSFLIVIPPMSASFRTKDRLRGMPVRIYPGETCAVGYKSTVYKWGGKKTARR